MQSNQTKINQDVAVALERVVGQLQELQSWRKEVDEERREYDRRRDSRADAGIRIDKSTAAILISMVTTLLLLWNVLHL